MSTPLLDTPELAAAYDDWGQRQLALGRRLVERLGLTGPPADILDIGCGTGLLTCELAEQGYAVTGLDPAHHRLHRAIERARPVAEQARFHLGRGEDLSAFADASFDAALMVCVADWLSDRAAAFAEAARVLRPAGRFGLVANASMDWAGALAQAGLTIRNAETTDETDEFASPDDLIAFAAASSFGAVPLPPADGPERAGVIAALLERYGDGSGAILRVPRPLAWVIAEKP